MHYTNLRKRMVEQQIKARGISNEQLLDAFMKVERHRFVPPAVEHFAYNDGPLSIGKGQTISQPYIVAMMLDLLDLTSSDNVLEIGTGSGYQTAIIAEMVNQVFSIERIPLLAVRARKKLEELDYSNVFIQIGDGTLGWLPESEEQEDLRFDKIIISAAAPSPPQSLDNQLKNGGRLIVPSGDKFIQNLTLIKKLDGKIEEENHGGCQFVPLIGRYGWKE